ncbi:hypothetical protein ACHQM5_022426 [Ranunculus cassubicifolius]
MISWKSMFLVLIVLGWVIFEEIISIPSCKIVVRDTKIEDVKVDSEEEEIRVMLVANLLLMGSEASYMNMYFRDSYMTKFFKKSFDKLQPDMLIVLGDVSARGSVLPKSTLLSVLQQFQSIVGPFLSLPLHVVLGDRDIGECSKLDVESVRWISSNLPGLDSSGSAAFEASNITFVSLNTVAMLCGNNDLRFSIESVIERESLDMQSESVAERTIEQNESFDQFRWRETDMPSGSGPVLLLHFPLYRTTSSSCGVHHCLGSTLSSGSNENINLLHSRGIAERGPYELLHTLPPNASEYIFQALKPRIIFSAQSEGFCDHTHKDGTREVSVPAMAWNARDDPGFVVATFGKNKSVSVSQCSLARETHVIIAYVCVTLLLISTAFVATKSQSIELQR